MGQDAKRAVDKLHQGYKNILVKRAERKLRKQGQFNTTLYLETRNHDEQLQTNLNVEVFGEFTNPQWSEMIPCVYDESICCFKAEVTIQIGDKFKFVINNGQRFLVSSRYIINGDEQGNEYNEYIPKEMHQNINEKKN